ncbi:hypothetical protein [Streptomyces lomondensis]|uniref:hypothetical protein n=1 Tax=Streptomyces lomondensis TaxID=68229 RepID=UPI003555F1C9
MAFGPQQPADGLGVERVSAKAVPGVGGQYPEIATVHWRFRLAQPFGALERIGAVVAPSNESVRLDQHKVVMRSATLFMAAGNRLLPPPPTFRNHERISSHLLVLC